MISSIMDNLAAGVDRREIRKSYPTLTELDIDAALSYAAELTREGIIDFPLEANAAILGESGFVADTLRDEGLTGSADHIVFTTCQRERLVCFFEGEPLSP